MWAWILRFSASHSSTAWLLVALLSVSVVAVGYVQGLRVKAARCSASLAVQEKYDNLVTELERRINDDRDAAIRALQNADHPCLDTPLRDFLLDPAPDSAVRDPGGTDAG